ncbi:RNA ligase [Algirhabdus cladophorae]|uniref:RNA ligase n=1 Tax=Algirhabdus cladophorae TaxID=3377108 RepID=UPI003B84AABA
MELIIETLEDVLPYITPDTGIIHSVHDGYSVINYVFTVDETFQSDIARECRGLKFAPDGSLIARPFHKFFNLGEKRPAQDEPWDSAHVVYDKLDGSMIHPAMVKGELLFMTRMGITDQAKLAFAHASGGVKALCREMIADGHTPVFEFTSPDNRIVVAYPDTALTLLAVRHIRTGAYMAHDQMAELAKSYGVPVAQTFEAVTDVAAFWAKARALEEVEGYVVAFENGHRLKLKADAYALRHKAISGLAYEKNVLAWVAQEAVDDVIPLLGPEDAITVLGYQGQVLRALTRIEADLATFVADHADLPRKDFAIKAKSELDPKLQSVAFRALDGTPIFKSLMEMVDRASGSDSKVDAIRPLIGMTWVQPQAAE